MGKRLVFVSLFFAWQASAQEVALSANKDNELLAAMLELELSLNNFLKIETSVASRRAFTTRETPGIVTVLTREEIRNSGARDLIDILRLVPGFHFGIEVQNVIGLGARGNYANEGKMLVLLDGAMINGLLYGDVSYGNHFPVEQIERIEVIRGPGSTNYGGFAELGVINIVMGRPSGSSATGVLGHTKNARTRKNLYLSAGHQVSDRFRLTAHAYVGSSLRSDLSYVVANGKETDARKYAAAQPLVLNLAVEAGDLTARIVYDDYYTEFPIKLEDGSLHDKPMEVIFRGLSAELRYMLRVSDWLTINPRLSYLYQDSWQTVSKHAEEQGWLWDKPVERLTSELTFAFHPTDEINVVLGGESFRDYAWVPTQSRYQGVFSYKNQDGVEVPSVTYSNEAAFLQADWATPFVNVIAGARLDHHSAFGTAWVPRAALTKIWDPIHAKLLFSKAFRAPTLENISENPKLSPERTTVLEAEIGCRFSETMMLTVNVFENRTKDTIIFQSDRSPRYFNSGEKGTRGAEGEFRVIDSWGYTTIGYSFYSVAKNTVALYAVPSREDVYLGFPAHKLTINGSVKVLDGLSVNPSLIGLSESFADRYAPESNVKIPAGHVKPTVLANLFVVYRGLAPGLELSAGIYNLLDKRVSFGMPYGGGIAPLPGPSREFLVRIRHAIDIQ